MKSRLVCLSLVLVLMAVFPLAGNAADQTFKWKFFSVAPVAHPTGKSLSDHLKKIDERTNGRLKIEFVNLSESPYKGNEALRLIRDGVVEGIDMLNGYNTGDAPLLAAVELPFMLPQFIKELDKFYAAYDAAWDDPGVKKILQQVWDQYNGEPMGRFYWGPQIVATRKGKEVLKAADLKGLQIREFSAEGADMLKAIGATAAVMTAAEVYTALQRGMCDGVISAAEALRYGKWFEVLKHVYICQVKASASFALFNKQKVALLPDDMKKVLREEMGAACKEINEYTVKNNPNAVKWLQDTHGWTINYASQEDYTYLRNLTKKEAWPKWVGRVGPVGKELLGACLKAMGDKEGI